MDARRDTSQKNYVFVQYYGAEENGAVVMKKAAVGWSNPYLPGYAKPTKFAGPVNQSDVSNAKGNVKDHHDNVPITKRKRDQEPLEDWRLTVSDENRAVLVDKICCRSRLTLWPVVVNI
eukprot:Phypoly_transcript_31356.p1 GENE.Phypoly_transcript_31356~~Phypoly_transcript_31356.p1  ORF type:complete len:133 (+),score=6.80 Phypoly_transcript_31356:43-399(+)